MRGFYTAARVLCQLLVLCVYREVDTYRLWTAAHQIFALDYINVHRVVLSALIGALSIVEGQVYWNAGLAYIGGEDVQQMNNLQFVFNQAPKRSYL